MGLNDTPLGERVHIAFFGCANAGKSSLLNAVTGVDTAVVSSLKGTTTDPVYKTMELLPAGPVVIIDTPGLDDESILGAQRTAKAAEVMRKTDVAVVVVDAEKGLRKEDEEIIEKLKKAGINYVTVYNKADLISSKHKENAVYVSAKTNEGIDELKLLIAEKADISKKSKPIVSDIVKSGSYVLLVIPIDKAAPKGRLILPQQQVIRELLDFGCIPVEVRESGLEKVIGDMGERISLVITDSQVFRYAAEKVPESIPLTSFSILFSRYKGDLKAQLKGIDAVKTLKSGDRVLISEGCAHHRQCGDIGTVKIPAALKALTGKNLSFSFTSAGEFPENLSEYRIVIHCGACMLNEKEMKARLSSARSQNIPVTNYGMLLALASGVLERGLKPLKGDF
ncbi:MAG: [FeFe] hydrogenase H-cluster maturation GTPase HydF [Clostridiales bacterium]|nr:[FeFe] hydrogenase H-cluster maturation GTPase HydF [Clostridiales bacterium]